MFELRKKQADGSAPTFLDEFADPYFGKKFPAVGDVVFKTAFPDGTHRSPGLLTVWRSPEGITVRVTDDEMDGVWQFTAETFEQACKRLEEALQAGKPPNRSNMSRPQRNGRKRN